MTSNQLWQAWRTFWFKPTSPISIAVYRIMFGLLVIQSAILLYPDLLIWYGRQAVVSVDSARAWSLELIIDPLLILPQTDQSIYLFFALFVVAAIGLTIGLFTRTSAFLVFLGLAAFQHRNWTIINSGDTFMRLAALYLSVSPAGRALSIDRLIDVWRAPQPINSQSHNSGPVKPDPSLTAPWVQRLMQVNLAMLYGQAFFSKISGATWVNGDALYYVLRLQDFQRFSFPWLVDNLALLKLLTWSVLLIELSLFTLIWIKELRYFVLLAAVMMHVSIDLSMNLPVFEYLMITAYVLFIDPEDLTWLIARVGIIMRSLTKISLLVIYDSQDWLAWRLAQTLRRLDCFGLLNLVDSSLPAASDRWAQFLRQTSMKGKDEDIEAQSEAIPRLAIFSPSTMKTSILISGHRPQVASESS